MLLAVTYPCIAGDAAKPTVNKEFYKLAETAFITARDAYLANTNNAPAALEFARVCYDWADFASKESEKAAIAQQGIAACRNVLRLSSNSAAGHYFLGMNLGQLADAKRGLEGLKITGQMEVEFKTAANEDARLDYAGPDRNLGLLYHQAPGWPLSVGNKTKAREHLEKALKLAADNPVNHLNLIEAELKWGDKKAAAAGLVELDKIWPEAKKQFTGVDWGPDWADWEKRRDALKKKLGAK